MVIVLGFSDYNFRDTEEGKLFYLRDDCVRNISKLFDEIKTENIHQDLYVFWHLLYKGYFSVDKAYEYSNSDILDEKNTIFLGKGCCRHTSVLLEECFDYSNRDYICSEIKVKMCNMKSLFKKQYNHSVVLAHDGAHLFLLDPTNLLEWQVLKNSKLFCLNDSYRLDRSVFKREFEASPKYRKFVIDDVELIDGEIIEEGYEVGKEICNANIDLFEDFFCENRPNYKKIKQMVLSKY